LFIFLLILLLLYPALFRVVFVTVSPSFRPILFVIMDGDSSDGAIEEPSTPRTPGGTRVTRDTPLIPDVFWCMGCFRHALGKYSAKPVGELEIICEYDGSASKMCRRCVQKKGVCGSVSLHNGFGGVSASDIFPQAAKMMVGDQYDFQKILDWTTVFFRCDDNLEGFWSESLEAGVSRAILQLSENFEAMEKSHRMEYGIATKKHDRVWIFLISWPFR
jgi:hypothetical protein